MWIAKLIPYRSSSRSSRSRASRVTLVSRLQNRSTEASSTCRSPSGRAANCRSASQSAAVSRPASVVSASRPTIGTTSETTRRSTFAWSLASGSATGHGSAPLPASLSTLLNRPSELIGLLDSRADIDRNASSAWTSSSRTDWVNT